jgi:uncharacterized repeat protein (TIGR03806 family)
MNKATLYLLVASLVGCPAPEVEEKPIDTGEPRVPLTRPANSSCHAPVRPSTEIAIDTERVHPNIAFSLAVFAYQAPGEDGYWYVGEQSGAIWRIADDPAVVDRELAVDLSGQLIVSYELGLLDVAFSPNFATDSTLYLSYTAPSQTGAATTVLSRVISPDGGVTFDLATETVLFELEQPYNNHNGGQIAFGLDGYLYLSLGDGGGGGDPGNHGQDPNTLLGSILRLDVSGSAGYLIPADNPFVAGGGREEIYAYGFRNPWRFSFDRETGELWVGDVGQYLWEEVDRVEPGGNYGWNIKEGSYCYEAATCDEAGLLDPIVEYDHSIGFAIIGGYVYRGEAIPQLEGTYLFTDHFAGAVMGITYDPVTGAAGWETFTSGGFRISAFAEANDGELYMLGQQEGLLQIVNAGGEPSSVFPQLLSQSGCVDVTDPTLPAEGLIPYEINAPFWSDGAEKRRWLAVPDESTIAVGDDGDWEFPVGSVLVKEFQIAGERIETRLMVRHDDGEWAGYTYAWNAAQTDASYVASGAVVETAHGLWSIPSGPACLQCHTEAAGRSLGLENAQLSLDVDFGDGVLLNQLAGFVEMGLIEAPGDVAALAAPFGDEPLEERARAYLHTNCSQCHRPEGGTAAPDLDFHFATPLDAMGACDVAPTRGDLGLEEPKLISPGAPEASVVIARMGSENAARMPPLGSDLVDEAGLQLIHDWIESLEDCTP